MNRINVKCFALLLVLLMAGCSVSQQDAESIAVSFVSDRVKFFARGGNGTQDVPAYAIDSVSSYQEDANWVVVIHVSSAIVNETKKNDLVVKVTNDGEVFEFNGVRVDRQ